MIEHTTQLRVRYADTDKMGIVYYGKYLEYFEVARTELLRSLGLPYRQVESQGVLLPVSEATVQYKRTAKYDDLLLVTTVIPKLPKASIHFEYTISHDSGRETVATGSTTLVFVNAETMRPVRAPAFVTGILAPYFDGR
ncbi:MAG: acyl-CoA thioesterase [Armatimonadetes bacterium]|nr:acyl-CoA thioesterase [Armatimonadota bacterium]